MKKRGEVWWVNFDPSIGEEIRKKRPAVILSNDDSNRFLRRYQVVPLSSNVKKVYPGEVKITPLGKENKAIADQLTTVSDLRFINKIGNLSKKGMIKIEDAVKFQLDL